MSPENLIIRPFEATDTTALSEIWFAASRIAHPFIGASRLTEQKLLIEEHYLPRAETWVALMHGQPVGFISLLDTFVGGLFVSPEQQGLGIGRRLATHALTLKGELTLEVYTENAQAMRFYRRLGFREISRRPFDDDGFPYENVRMHRTV